MMKRRILGRSGLEVTPLGFGSQTVGGLGYGDQDWDASEPTVAAYLAGGGRFIDTARGYGVSEIYVGKALKKFRGRKDVVVCSKSGATHPPIIRADMEVSRFCIQRDVIDVYYIHVPPKDLDEVRRVLDAYQRFKDEGKIRLVGLSNRGLTTQEERDQVWKFFEDGRIDVMQFPYSFARPEVEPLIAEAKRRGIGVVVRQALEGGMFTDKFRPGHRFTDRANDWRAGIDPKRMERALQTIEGIRRRFVKPPYRSLAQLALSFVLSSPDVTATIPGAGSVAEMRDNLSANDVPLLPAATAAELREAARGLLELMR
jgi:aryl-alcohol dehydrogenase-like predicted oxidoreductase